MKTKTFIILSGLLLFTSYRLYSQDFKFGFLGGMDIAKSYLTDLPDNSAASEYYPMISYNLNGYIAYKTAGIFGISAEPGFIQKGFIQKYEGSNLRFQLNYLQIPVFADIHITNKIFLSVGPEFAYLLNAKIKPVNDKGDKIDLYDKRKFEISAIAGLNYEITNKFDAGLRYSRGLTYTVELNYTDANGHLVANPKEFNQYFQLIVRYKI